MQRQRRLGRDSCQPAQRGAVGEQVDRQACHHLFAVEDRQLAVVGDIPDDRGCEVPGPEDALHLGLTAALDHDEHALLRFRQHHVVRRHPSLAAWHQRDVDAGARAGNPPRTLRHRRR